MNEQEREAERLRQLRNRQLQSRDPGKKQRKVQKNITDQYRRTSKKFTLGLAWRNLHHRWKGMIIGLGIGAIIAVLLSIYSQELWADLIGIIAIVICAAIGLVFGASFDWRDDIRDL